MLTKANRKFEITRYWTTFVTRQGCLMMLILLSLMFAILPPESVQAGQGEWTWMSGASTGGQSGVYGAQGVPDPANVPGERYDSISWTDSAGNLWMFGGNSSVDGPFNDLWRYDVASGLWTWIDGSNTAYHYGVYGTQGVPGATNMPGSRFGAISWYDTNGQAWLFGGRGAAASGTYDRLNDLWRYNPTTGWWTWMSGANTTGQPGTYAVLGAPDAANMPGSRQDSVSWTDASGRLWLFGGGLESSGVIPLLNDLWYYDPASGHWAWMGGSSTTNQPGVYGTQGVPAATNVPGAREDALSWTDGAGGLWLHGGRGYDGNGDLGFLNDLWRYDIASGEWTWISGSSLRNQFGVYGVQGVASSSNAPGGRGDGVAWVDDSNDLWLFGGYGRHTTSYGFVNDLWRYSPASGLWTWVDGSNQGEEVGVYGTLGSPAPSNVPGARRYAVSWSGPADTLWLLGGRGKDGTGGAGYAFMNDLWRYELGAPLAVTLASFAATAQPDNILVTWETVSEINNSGFNLFRGFTDDWNSATLLAYVPSQSPGSAQGFAYSVADADAQPGQTIWYWLEDIDLGGTVTLHGPVSAMMQTPTAVTLTALNAGSPPALPPVAPGILALAVAVGLFLRRNRQARPTGGPG